MRPTYRLPSCLARALLILALVLVATTARASRGGHATVSLVGFAQPLPSGAREVGAMLMFALPFDRFVRASPPRVLSDPQADPDEGAGAPEPAPAAAPSPAPVSPRASPRPDALLALAPRLARACVKAAWRAAGLGGGDERLDGIVSRARWSALLPEARLRATRYDIARLYTTTSTESDTAKYRDSAAANLGLEARLTWHLDRLVYAGDEPSIERLRLARRDAREHVAGRVLEALFRWERAFVELGWAELSGQTRDGEDVAEVALTVAEAEATLDVLTAGWFSRWRARTLPRPAPPAR